MRDAADVIGMQVSDDDLAESLPLLDKSGDNLIERRLLIGVWRAGINHYHLVAADEVTVGMSRGRDGWRAQRAEEKAVAELDSTFKGISFFLRDAEHSLGEILDAFGHALNRADDRRDDPAIT